MTPMFSKIQGDSDHRGEKSDPPSSPRVKLTPGVRKNKVPPNCPERKGVSNVEKKKR